MIVGIRREDKNEWERRAPLAPEHVGRLIAETGAGVIVQPSVIRVFADAEYEAAGATVNEDLVTADVVLAVKEIPTDLLMPGRTYLFFSHTIKGQAANMPMLARLLELGCTLIDYEPIADEEGRRLIFFGRFAGIAGMIDTLWSLGQRLLVEGIETPFASIRPAHVYDDLEAAKEAVRIVGERIASDGLPDAIRTPVFGIAGYGNTSRGAQEILALLPVEERSPETLLDGTVADRDPRKVYQVIFKEGDTMRPIAGGAFEMAAFLADPSAYESKFAAYLPHLTALVNCIYWAPGNPRLVTREDVRRLWDGGPPRLRVIGDVSCDVEGGVEVTVKATEPDAPTYVYDPRTGQAVDGFAGNGPVVLAVDNLPCELPRESTRAFGDALMTVLPGVLAADLTAPLDASGLPAEVGRAAIVYRGELTPRFLRLRAFLGGPDD